MISIIVACDPNGVIGFQGNLPWHIPDDLKLFKSITLNSSVIMGRKTWESIPSKFKPLRERVNIVVTSQSNYCSQYKNRRCFPFDETFFTAKNPFNAVELAKYWYPHLPIFVIGGESVYKETIKIAQKLHISHVKKNYQGDSHFFFNKTEWLENSAKEYKDFIYKEYIRI